MKGNWSTSDLRKEILHRRRRTHYCNEQVMCQQPRLVYSGNMIRLHVALFCLRRAKPGLEESLWATIMLYAHPVHRVQFPRPQNELRQDLEMVFIDPAHQRMYSYSTQKSLQEALQRSLRAEAACSMQLRRQDAAEANNTKALRRCRNLMPLPRAHFAL